VKGSIVKEDRVIYRELSFRVVGCGQKVHRELGPGFPESVYHKAMCYELVTAQIPFDTEKAVEVDYLGRPCGQFRMDLLVNDQIIVELKAADRLNDNHLAQALSYLKAARLKLAILMNFGATTLETRRVIL
jgi:GxxExxY protein